MIEVEAYGSIIEFPDGTPKDTMRQAIQRRFGPSTSHLLQNGAATPDAAAAPTWAPPPGSPHSFVSALGQPKPYDDIINREATAQGVDPDLIRAMIRQESAGDPAAVSPKGARGLMQLMPGTAKELGVTDPFNPEQNIRGGVTYMRQMLDKFGDRALALAGYNAGPGRVKKGAKLPAETQDYIRKVGAFHDEFRKSRGGSAPNQEPWPRATQQEPEPPPAPWPQGRQDRVSALTQGKPFGSDTIEGFVQGAMGTAATAARAFSVLEPSRYLEHQQSANALVDAQAAREQQASQGFIDTVQRGTMSSMTQMVPSAMVGGSAGAIGMFGAQEAAQQDNLPDALAAATIEMGPAAAMQRLGLGGLESALGNLVKQGIPRNKLSEAVKGTLKTFGLEFPEEVVTELGLAVHEVGTGENPKALMFYDPETDTYPLPHRMGLTAAQTAGMVGSVGAPNVGRSAIDDVNNRARERRARQFAAVSAATDALRPQGGTAVVQPTPPPLPGADMVPAAQVEPQFRTPDGETITPVLAGPDRGALPAPPPAPALPEPAPGLPEPESMPEEENTYRARLQSAVDEVQAIEIPWGADPTGEQATTQLAIAKAARKHNVSREDIARAALWLPEGAEGVYVQLPSREQLQQTKAARPLEDLQPPPQGSPREEAAAQPEPKKSVPAYGPEWRKAIVDAAHERLASGKKLTLSTHARGQTISSPEHIRFHNGNVQVRGSGKSYEQWYTWNDNYLNALAKNLGLPEWDPTQAGQEPEAPATPPTRGPQQEEVKKQRYDIRDKDGNIIGGMKYVHTERGPFWNVSIFKESGLDTIKSYKGFDQAYAAARKLGNTQRRLPTAEEQVLARRYSQPAPDSKPKSPSTGPAVPELKAEMDRAIDAYRKYKGSDLGKEAALGDAAEAAKQRYEKALRAPQRGPQHQKTTDAIAKSVADLEAGTSESAQGVAMPGKAKAKAKVKTKAQDRVDVSNDALTAFREEMKKSGIKPSKDILRKNTGLSMPPGYVNRGSKISWDQALQTAEEMGLDVGNHKPEDLVRLLRGENIKTVTPEADMIFREYGTLSPEATHLISKHGSAIEAVKWLIGESNRLEAAGKDTTKIDKLLLEFNKQQSLFKDFDREKQEATRKAGEQEDLFSDVDSDVNPDVEEESLFMEAPKRGTSLAQFAADASEAARTSPGGWFGDPEITRKVFIHYAWARYRNLHPESKMSLDEFKERLVEAQQAGLVTLSRADLVEAMLQSDVKLSQTGDDILKGYNFITFDEEGQRWKAATPLERLEMKRDAVDHWIRARIANFGEDHDPMMLAEKRRDLERLDAQIEQMEGREPESGEEGEQHLDEREARPGGGATQTQAPNFGQRGATPSAIALPELVALMRDFMGKLPKITTKRMQQALGRFSFREGEKGSGRISLHPGIFLGESLTSIDSRSKLTAAKIQEIMRNLSTMENIPVDGISSRTEYNRRKKRYTTTFYRRDPNYAATVLAHEIGHAVDFLPDATMKRGNILGHIAKLKKFLEDFLPFAPGAPGPLTDADRQRLKQEAEQAMPTQTIEEVIEEFTETVSNITPEDIKAIWNSIEGTRDTNPELWNYIAAASREEKVAIVKQAMKGIVADQIKHLGTTRRTVTGRRTVTRTVPPTKKDIEKRLKELIEEEITRRRLWRLEQVRKEMQDLTLWWRPFDPTDKKQRSYRFSAAELYADATSVLVNAPDEFKRRAPHAYQAMMNYMATNPEFQEAYQAVQSLIAQGKDATVDARLDRQGQAFRRGWELRQGMAKRPRSTFAEFKHRIMSMFVDKRAGVPKQTQRLINEYMHLGARQHLYVQDVLGRVNRLIQEQGLNREQVGQYLKDYRASTERAELANPGGVGGPFADEALARLHTQVGDTAYAALEEIRQHLWRVRSELILPKLDESGIMSPELRHKVMTNDEYVTFNVLHYMEEQYQQSAGAFYREPSAQIHRQVGTLQDIEDPLDATVMKDLALLRSAYMNIAKRTLAQELTNLGAARPAKFSRGQDGRKHFLEPADPKQGLLLYLDNGEMVGTYVSRTALEWYEQNPSHAGAALSAAAWFLRTANSPFKAVFIEYNPGFGVWNMRRDAKALFKNLPGGVLRNTADVTRGYLHTARAALLDAYTDQHSPLTRELYVNNALIVGHAQFGVGAGTDTETELDRIAYQFLVKPETERSWYRRLGQFLNPRNFNQFTERWAKLAAADILKRRGGGKLAAEDFEFIRNRAGSPNFLAKGTLTPVMGELFLFSNPQIQGWRASLGALRDNPAEYFLKTMAADILPKALMFAAGAGILDYLFDLDDEPIKDMMARIPEYEKLTRFVLPLGMTESGETVYLPIPQDHTGQLLGSALWLTLKQAQRQELWPSDFGRLADTAVPYTRGNLSPALEMMLDLGQMVRGQNPTDEWTGRPALDETVHQAGGARAWGDFAQFQFNQALGTFHRFETRDVVPDRGEGAGALNIPVAGPFLQRFIRVSDRGLDDQLREALRPAAVEDARLNLAIQDIISSRVNALPATASTSERRRDATAAYRDAKAAGLLKPMPGERIPTVAQFRVRYDAVADKRFGTLVDRARVTGPRARQVLRQAGS